jgi:hypothetical protein
VAGVKLDNNTASKTKKKTKATIRGEMVKLWLE